MRAHCSTVNVSLLTFIAKAFLQFWHLIITSAFLSFVLDSFANLNTFAESQALLLQIGQLY